MNELRYRRQKQVDDFNAHQRKTPSDLWKSDLDDLMSKLT